MKNPFQKTKALQPDTPTTDAPDPLIVDEPVEDAPVVTLTDEGVPYERINVETIGADTIVNQSTDAFDAHRQELHIDGRTFTHVSDAGDGAWIYRHDKQ